MSNVKGLKELNDKLAQLGVETGRKALRSAGMSATLPTVKRLKAVAPRGEKAHRTYKGRLVAPGFLSRSIRRVSTVDKKTGKVRVMIGVRREAFYGIQFLDKGTKYIQGRDWFASNFESDANKITGVFKDKLTARIAKLKR